MHTGDRHSAAARERIVKGTRWGIEKRRRIARIAPGEIVELQRNGTLSASLKPYAAQAVEESLGFIQALGGEDGGVSEQRIALVQDVTRAGLLMRALMAQMLQQDGIDAEGVTRVTSLISARRQNLVALGLDRVERELPDLQTYITQCEDSAHNENDSGGGPEVKSVAARGTPASDKSHGAEPGPSE